MDGQQLIYQFHGLNNNAILKWSILTNVVTVCKDDDTPLAKMKRHVIIILHAKYAKLIRSKCCDFFYCQSKMSKLNLYSNSYAETTRVQKILDN